MFTPFLIFCLPPERGSAPPISKELNWCGLNEERQKIENIHTLLGTKPDILLGRSMKIPYGIVCLITPGNIKPSLISAKLLGRSPSWLADTNDCFKVKLWTMVKEFS
jgi:hypothetical protein